MRILVTVLLIMTLICCAMLFFYSYKKRALPGAWYFMLLAGAALFVNAGYIGELNSDTIQTALFWSGVEHNVLPFHPYLWFLISLDYTQVCRRKRLVQNIMLIFPAFYLFVFINKRLLKYYGEGLAISSSDGTIVTFRIPLSGAVNKEVGKCDKDNCC